MIKCTNISVSFDKKILKDFSLTIKDGRICVIIGPNGSGKTTLIKAISKQISFTGNIEIDNQNINLLKHKELAKMLSVMPQRLPEPNGITVQEIISFARTPYTPFNAKLSIDDKKIIEESINYLSINHLKNKYIRELSGGEKQKVFFAMTIAQDTNNIILDEATSNLDISNKSILFDFITKLKKQGKTVLVILHDINDAIKIADDICLLINGDNKFHGSKKEFIDNEIAEKYFNLERINYQNKIFYSTK